MENIQHKYVEVRGLKLHVAEIGSGSKVVLFLHGFPEIWYTWRHQMIAVANKGYRAIAFDWRGYGLSELPPNPENGSFRDLIDDVVALLDALAINKVFLVAKDFGSRSAYLVSALHPERVCGVVTLGVPFVVPGSSVVQFHVLPKGFYITRFQEPGRAEADFSRFDVKTAFLVGKDFGALPAYMVPALHPERVSGVVTLGIPFIVPGPSAIQQHLLPEGFYVSRWQEPGRAEKDFGRFDVKTVIRNIYTLFSRSEIPIAKSDQEIMDLFDPSTPLPPWFSDQDLLVYASLYEISGFRFPLRVPYRTLSTDIGITDPKVTAPVLLVMGEKDYCLKLPGFEDFIRSGAMKQFVPDLDITFVAEGSHFVHEQFPEQINELITTFLDKHGIS
ncbi:hypothetical protein UlMin_014245 [Ulmus minor]